MIGTTSHDIFTDQNHLGGSGGHAHTQLRQEPRGRTGPQGGAPPQGPRVELVLRVKASPEGGASFSVLRMELLLSPCGGAAPQVGVSPQAGLRVELLLGPRGGAAPVSSVWSSSSGWRIFQFWDLAPP